MSSEENVCIGDLEITIPIEGKDEKLKLREVVDALKTADCQEYYDVGWPESVPVPIDHTDQRVSVQDLQKQIAEGEDLFCATYQLQKLDKKVKEMGQKIWAEEKKQSGIGRRIDDFSMKALFMETGFASQFEPMTSKEESYGKFGIIMTNKFSTFFPTCYTDPNTGEVSYYMIFSCIFSSVRVGQLAREATDGDWKWENLSDKWVKESIDKFLDHKDCKIPPEIKDKICRTSLLIDTYTGLLIGSFDGIPYKRESLQVTYHKNEGNVTSMKCVIQYRRKHRKLIREKMKMLYTNYKNLYEANAELIKQIETDLKKELGQ